MTDYGELFWVQHRHANAKHIENLKILKAMIKSLQLNSMKESGGFFNPHEMGIIEDMISILGNFDYEIYEDSIFQFNGLKVTTEQIKFVLNWLNENKPEYDLSKQPKFDFVLVPKTDNCFAIVIIHHPNKTGAYGHEKFPLNVNSLMVTSHFSTHKSYLLGE